jgi:hypothetical protein
MGRMQALVKSYLVLNLSSLEDVRMLFLWPGYVRAC